MARGQSVTDPKEFGNWIADIERPAAQYRGRYGLRLGEANGLLGHAADKASLATIARLASFAQPTEQPSKLASAHLNAMNVRFRGRMPWALAFSFVNPEEARNWAEIYYGIIKSEQCVPLGHAVNANIAMVSNFSVHHDRAEAIRRGQEGFEFFGYAVNALVAHDAVPGRSRLFEDFQKSRARQDDEIIAATKGAARNANGIGTPDDIRAHIRAFSDSGIDQVIFLQQAGRNKHADICESLELFAAEVMGAFKAEVAAREAKKAAELSPYIAAAMARKQWMKPLADDEIPVVKASVQRAQINAETR